MSVGRDGPVFGRIGKDRGAVIVDAVIFPHQGVPVGVGVIVCNDPLPHRYPVGSPVSGHGVVHLARYGSRWCSVATATKLSIASSRCRYWLGDRWATFWERMERS